MNYFTKTALTVIEFTARKGVVVIRFPIQALAAHLENSSFMRVNMEYADVPDELKHKSVSVQGNIKAFIEGVLKNKVTGAN